MNELQSLCLPLGRHFDTGRAEYLLGTCGESNTKQVLRRAWSFRASHCNERNSASGSPGEESRNGAVHLLVLETPKLEVDQAASAGHVKVLDRVWEESNGAVHPSATGLRMAAAAGKILTLEWAHSRQLPGFQGLMDVAAWRGRLAVLKWLFANRVEGCTVNAANWAAQRGHLKVLRWLRDVVGQKCTNEGLEAAATAGHVPVVAWLLSNSRDQRAPAVITPAIISAASNGHVEVLKLLLPVHQEKEQEKSGWALALATRGEHRECIQLLQAAGWPKLESVAVDEDWRATSPEVEEDDTFCHGEGGRMMLTDEGKHRSGDATEGNWDGELSRASHQPMPTAVPGTRPRSRLLNGDRVEPLPLTTSSSGTTPPFPILPLSVEFSRQQPADTPPPRVPEILKTLTPAGETYPCQQEGRARAATSACWPFPRGKGPKASGGPEKKCCERGGGKGWKMLSSAADDTFFADGNDRSLDDWRRADWFLQATEAVAFGKKSSVRDVWSPVSGHARLNLGALGKESQEPVIAAYLEGLFRGPGTAYQNHQLPLCVGSSTPPCQGPRSTADVSAHRSARLSPFHRVIGRRIPSPLLPAPVRRPPAPAVSSAFAVTGAATPAATPAAMSTSPARERATSRGPRSCSSGRKQGKRPWGRQRWQHYADHVQGTAAATTATTAAVPTTPGRYGRRGDTAPGPRGIVPRGCEDDADGILFVDPSGALVDGVLGTSPGPRGSHRGEGNRVSVWERRGWEVAGLYGAEGGEYACGLAAAVSRPPGNSHPLG